MAMVFYLINILGIQMAMKMMLVRFNVTLKDHKVTFLAGFYMLLPLIATNLLAILQVFLYSCAAYTQRKEQQKPTEDAPKEILMYWNPKAIKAKTFE